MVHPRLQLFVEIDHYVAAQDYLKLIERTVSCQVVFREDQVALQARTKDHAVVLRRVVVRKLVYAAGLVVIRRVLSHGGEGKNSIPRAPQNCHANVGGVDATLLIKTFLLQQNRERIDFFTGRTTGDPNLNRRIGTQQWNNSLTKREVETGIAKHCGGVYRKSQQKAIERSRVVQYPILKFRDRLQMLRSHQLEYASLY